MLCVTSGRIMVQEIEADLLFGVSKCSSVRLSRNV